MVSNTIKITIEVKDFNNLRWELVFASEILSSDKLRLLSKITEICCL